MSFCNYGKLLIINCFLFLNFWLDYYNKLYVKSLVLKNIRPHYITNSKSLSIEKYQ